MGKHYPKPDRMTSEQVKEQHNAALYTRSQFTAPARGVIDLDAAPRLERIMRDLNLTSNYLYEIDPDETEQQEYAHAVTLAVRRISGLTNELDGIVCGLYASGELSEDLTVEDLDEIRSYANIKSPLPWGLGATVKYAK